MGNLMIVFVLCAAAEAGPSAGKTFKVSVTLPATSHVQAKQSMTTQDTQIAMERDIRDNKLVTVKSIISK